MCRDVGRGLWHGGGGLASRVGRNLVLGGWRMIVDASLGGLCRSWLRYYDADVDVNAVRCAMQISVSRPTWRKEETEK